MNLTTKQCIYTYYDTYLYIAHGNLDRIVSVGDGRQT